MSTMASRNVEFIRGASSSFVAHDSEANDQAPIVLQSNKQTYLLGFRVRHARKVRPINGRSPGGVPVQGDSLLVPFPRKRLFPFYRFRTRKQLKSLTPLKHPAARTLASMVTDDDLTMGRIYPSLSRIREVSRVIAIEVATLAFDRGLARVERPADIAAAVRDAMFEPHYVSLL